MSKTRCPVETGELAIQGHKMSWKMQRTQSESAFGIRGSRIFHLLLKKDGQTVGEYDRGWSKSIEKEDEESALCLSYLVDKYGRMARKKKREMGSPI